MVCAYRVIATGEVTASTMSTKRKLTELKPGEKGHIVSVSAQGSLCKKMLDMGLVVGAELKVVRLAPAGDPVEVLIRGYCLALRKNEAINLTLEVD